MIPPSDVLAEVIDACELALDRIEVYDRFFNAMARGLKSVSIEPPKPRTDVEYCPNCGRPFDDD